MAVITPESTVGHWHKGNWCREALGWDLTAELGISDSVTIRILEQQQHPQRAIVPERTPLPFLSLTTSSLSERSISGHSAQCNASSSAPLCHSRSAEANHCLSKGKPARMHFSPAARAARKQIAGCHRTNPCASSPCVLSDASQG